MGRNLEVTRGPTAKNQRMTTLARCLQAHLRTSCPCRSREAYLKVGDGSVRRKTVCDFAPAAQPRRLPADTHCRRDGGDAHQRRRILHRLAPQLMGPRHLRVRGELHSGAGGAGAAGALTRPDDDADADTDGDGEADITATATWHKCHTDTPSIHLLRSAHTEADDPDDPGTNAHHEARGPTPRKYRDAQASASARPDLRPPQYPGRNLHTDTSRQPTAYKTTHRGTDAERRCTRTSDDATPRVRRGSGPI